jgi:hypothetical protein
MIILTENEIINTITKSRSLSEKRLVEIFATNPIQERYGLKHRFTGNDKKRVLERASNFCVIKDYGDKHYYISKVYQNPPPLNFDKMSNDIYQYLCPIILNIITSDNYKEDAQKLYKWAIMTKMINENYYHIKNYPNTSMEQFYIKPKPFRDFYTRCESAIEYYIPKAFKYLQDADLITYDEVYYYKPAKSVIEIDGIKYKSVKSPKQVRATEDDIQFYFDCMKNADIDVDIKKSKERYFGSKSKIYKNTLSEKLAEKNILYFYKTYECHVVNKARCIAVMEMFDFNDIYTKLNQIFIDKLLTNAANCKKNDKEENRTEYLDNFADMCDITINHQTESVKERLVCCSTHNK